MVTNTNFKTSQLFCKTCDLRLETYLRDLNFLRLAASLVTGYLEVVSQRLLDFYRLGVHTRSCSHTELQLAHKQMTQ